jgi:DNA-binding NarL/FixJ family response regulator
MSSRQEDRIAKARRPSRVLICNHHTLFRHGIKALLEQAATIEIVGEAPTARRALSLLERVQPDVVLMDTTMPDLTGSEAIRRIKALYPGVTVLILSLNGDEKLVAHCLEAGAYDYIRSNDQPVRLKRAINNACRRVAHAA